MDNVLDLQEQLEKLQTQIAFQDDLIDTLNQAVASQSREIDLLKQQLQFLYEQMKEQIEKNAAGSFSQIEIPPHY